MVMVMVGVATFSCSRANPPADVTTHRLGESATLGHGFVLTVREFDPTVDPALQPGTSGPDPGVVFSAVSVSGCVPAAREAGVSTDFFSPDARFFGIQVENDPRMLHLVPSQEARNNAVEPGSEELLERKSPEDNSFEPAPGQCTDGWVTFEVPAGARPSFAVYVNGQSVLPGGG